MGHNSSRKSSDLMSRLEHEERSANEFDHLLLRSCEIFFLRVNSKIEKLVSLLELDFMIKFIFLSL